jgi:hypothetical protein
VKHIGPEGLDKLEGLLEALRRQDGLKEKKRGVFYRKSRAFLHFHEDPAGLFADVRLSGPDFDRLPVNSRAEWKSLLAKIDAVLSG